jgi:hypothetical protein
VDVRVGLCGWTVSQASYVHRFPLVEVQHTFYEPPPDAVLSRWRAAVPDGFEFTLKAWQLVTHESGSPTYRRLKRPCRTALAVRSAPSARPPRASGLAADARVRRVLRGHGGAAAVPEELPPDDGQRRAAARFLSEVERPDARLLWEPRGAWPPSLLTSCAASSTWSTSSTRCRPRR